MNDGDYHSHSTFADVQSFRVRPLALCVHLALAASVTALASEAPADADDAPVPTVTVSAARANGFVAQHAASSTKSEASPYDTPQAIPVLTRACPDACQVTSLDQAIQTTAGVASGGYGRRDWDDYTIRGQRASESLYVDGLKPGHSNYVAQEVFGVNSIEVVKGPASINFGQMQPGGIVNMACLSAPRASAPTMPSNAPPATPRCAIRPRRTWRRTSVAPRRSCRWRGQA